MKRLLATLTVVAALFTVALPAQAASAGRTHLGHVATATERASFGCGTDGPAVSFLLHHNGHWVIAPKGTIKHPGRIRFACSFVTPQPVSTATPEQTADIWCINVTEAGTVWTHCLP